MANPRINPSVQPFTFQQILSVIGKRYSLAVPLRAFPQIPVGYQFTVESGHIDRDGSIYAVLWCPDRREDPESDPNYRSTWCREIFDTIDFQVHFEESAS